MLTHHRKRLIQDELARAGRVIANDLAERFKISPDTIRRDLRQMAAEGQCQRVYGGAIAPTAGTLAQRHAHLATEKARLAEKAAALLQPGQTVMIDAGSTNTAVARALPLGLNLTVVTNAPDIAHLLTQRDDLRLITLGGVYHPQLGACLGPATRAAIAEIQTDWLFLGSCGMSANGGVTAFDAGEAEVKAQMAASSQRIAAVVTQEKIETTAPFPVIRTREITTLVTTTHPALDGYRTAGVEVITTG